MYCPEIRPPFDRERQLVTRVLQQDPGVHLSVCLSVCLYVCLSVTWDVLPRDPSTI